MSPPAATWDGQPCPKNDSAATSWLAADEDVRAPAFKPTRLRFNLRIAMNQPETDRLVAIHIPRLVKSAGLIAGGWLRTTIIVFVKFVPECPNADPQDFCGVRAVAFALVKSGEDVTFLDFT